MASAGAKNSGEPWPKRALCGDQDHPVRAHNDEEMAYFRSKNVDMASTGAKEIGEAMARSIKSSVDVYLYIFHPAFDDLNFYLILKSRPSRDFIIDISAGQPFGFALRPLGHH